MKIKLDKEKQKAVWRKASLKYYHKNRNVCLARIKKYNKEHRKERSEYQKKWRDENQNKHKKYVDNYKKSNLEKIRVWDKARRKIKLQGMCQICHENKAVDRHHPNYDEPLKVIFVCKQCHKDIHSQCKKDGDSPYGNHLGTRNKAGEDNLVGGMPVIVDSHADIFKGGKKICRT